MHLRQFIFGFVFLVTSSLALSNAEFTYNVIDDGIEVTGCVNECPSDLVIPEEIDGYVVTIIGYFAFGENHLVSVVIPDSVYFIGPWAFAANQLTSVTIPDSVISIGISAFFYNQLTSVTIPDSVASVMSNAFGDNQLTSVTIPVSMVSIGPYAFGDNQLTSVTFLGDRPEIDSEAFSNNNNLSSVSYRCLGASGWPGEPIEGITPQLDEICGDSNDHGDDDHADEDHGDEEYCYPYGDEHEEHEDGHEEEHDHDGHCYSAIDLDQNGSFEALTDALILLRYAFGLRGDNLN